MRGRPKKPEDEVRRGVLRVRLTDAEREQFDRAARALDQDVSSWVRQVALKAARKALHRA